MGFELKNDRPLVQVPVTRPEKIVEAVAVCGLVAIVAVGVLYYATLPDLIPRHVNAAGVVDAWGSKSYMIAFFAGIAFLLYGLMTVFGSYPRWYNYPVKITTENAPRMYRLGRSLIRVIKAEVMWLFVVLEWQFFQIALGQNSFFIILLVPAQMILFLGTLLYFLAQMSTKPVRS